ncbi:hypothetical protein [Streptomyces griseoluteus]|uniref:hypothetical protein n=1 Tax=Streptomyces griseoluteus TaxID=29306 RepID=UPI003426E341
MVPDLVQRADEAGITQLLFEKGTDVVRIGLAAARAKGILEAPELPKWMRRRQLKRMR